MYVVSSERWYHISVEMYISCLMVDRSIFFHGGGLWGYHCSIITATLFLVAWLCYILALDRGVWIFSIGIFQNPVVFHLFLLDYWDNLVWSSIYIKHWVVFYGLIFVTDHGAEVDFMIEIVNGVFEVSQRVGLVYTYW